MNLLAVAILVFLAVFFLFENMMVFALVCFMGLILLLYYSKDEGKSAAHAGGCADYGYEGGSPSAPVVVRLGQKHGKKHPELYRVRVYPTWQNRSMWEELGKNFLGPVMEVFGSTAYRAATGKHSQKGMDIQPDEMFRGR